MKTNTRLALFTALVAAMPMSGFCLDLLPDGGSISGGKSFFKNHADVTSGRLALRWDWKEELFSQKTWKIDSYVELSYSQWKSHFSDGDPKTPDTKNKIWQSSLSPILRLSPKSSRTIDPFFDFGVGLSYQSDKDLAQQNSSAINMGGTIQFELRLMGGFKFGAQKNYEIAYGWFHYSNAYLHSKNEGLDFQMLSLSMNW